jgi:hypothetical protein
MQQRLRIAAVALAWVLVSSSGAAATTYSGTISAVLDTPVLSGTYLAVGTRQPIARDNASTARASGIGTSSVAWGGANNNNGAPFAPSTLVFTGDAFTDVAAGQIFQLGTLTSFNGQSAPESLIFGLTMHLSAGDGITAVAVPVAIVSTLNGNADRVADADVLVFGELATPSALAAFEGAAVTAIVRGKIGDDGQLEVTSMSLAPGEADHGCLDAGNLADALPCASVCGSVCAAISGALASPLCGSERLPAALSGRIAEALHVLGEGASARSHRKARKSVRVAMKQLRRSARMASRAAARGRISAACGEAIGRTVGNARSQAEPLLRTR